MKKICLLDLNYTLVGNQAETRMLRPFSRRMEAEEYRRDLIDAIKDDYVIIITARPDYQMRQTMENIRRKTGWQPQEWYFNDINAEPRSSRRAPFAASSSRSTASRWGRRGPSTTPWRATRRPGRCIAGSESRASPTTSLCVA